MGRHSLVEKIVGAELKLMIVSIVIGAVAGAVLWDRYGEAVKAWAEEQRAACPLRPQVGGEPETAAQAAPEATPVAAPEATSVAAPEA